MFGRPRKWWASCVRFVGVKTVPPRVVHNTVPPRVVHNTVPQRVVHNTVVSSQLAVGGTVAVDNPRWDCCCWQPSVGAVGSWQLAVGCWLLAVGSWQLAVGCCCYWQPGRPVVVENPRWDSCCWQPSVGLFWWKRKIPSVELLLLTTLGGTVVMCLTKPWWACCCRQPLVRLFLLTTLGGTVLLTTLIATVVVEVGLLLLTTLGLFLLTTLSGTVLLTTLIGGPVVVDNPRWDCCS